MALKENFVFVLVILSLLNLVVGKLATVKFPGMKFFARYTNIFKERPCHGEMMEGYFVLFPSTLVFYKTP